jgi:hypothetical protein
MTKKEMATQKTDTYAYALHAMTDGCKQAVMNHGHLTLMAESGHPANQAHAGPWNAEFERSSL